MPTTHWICGYDDLDRLHSAIRAILRRHPNLRIINAFYPLKERPEGLETTYYRDYLSQQDEIPLFARAYKDAGAMLALARQRSSLSAALFSVALHDIALHLFDHLVYQHVQAHAAEDTLFISRHRRLSLRGFIRPFMEMDREMPQTVDPRDTTLRLAPLDDLEDPVVIVSDDSGTRVNASTYLPLIKSLAAQGGQPVFMGMNASSCDEVKTLGHATCSLASPPLCDRKTYRAVLRDCADIISRVLFGDARLRRVMGDYRLGGYNATGLGFLSLTALEILWLTTGHTPRAVYTDAALQTLKARGARKIVAVNESLGSCSLAVEVGRLHGFTSYGLSTILYMRHPTCRHFPADHHYVYGRQLTEIMLDCGIAPDRIHEVGSYHFDRARHRVQEDDAKLCDALLPERAGRPLVIIATECRPKQHLEIEPTLAALAERDDILTVLKLHPSEVAAPFEEMLARLGNPSHIILVGQCDTLALVANADVLITMGSNLIVEAAVLGTPSISYNYTGAPCPIDFVHEGLCLGATTPEECLRLIEGIAVRGEAYDKAMALLENVTRFNAVNDGMFIERMTAAIIAKP